MASLSSSGDRRRSTLALIGVVQIVALSVVAVGSGAVQARSARTAAVDVAAATARAVPASNTPAMLVSPNWSGYVAAGTTAHPVAYSTVSGTWTVPTATCGAKDNAGSFSTIWVGLGGYTTKDSEMVGTDQNCGGLDKPVYYAWYELQPYISYDVPKTYEVMPGDTMTGEVQSLSIRLVKLQIEDISRGWTFTRDIDFGLQDTSTAEWIAESPASCHYYICSQANLTNFGSATFTGISATGNGTTGNLSDPDWNVTPIQLVPGQLLVPTITHSGQSDTPAAEATLAQEGHASSPAGATPGHPLVDGSSFKVKWVAVATKGV